MNNEDTPQSAQINNVDQSLGPNLAPVPTPVTPKQSPNWLKISLTVALSVIVILLVAGAYYLGTMSPNRNVADTTASTQTSTKTTQSELPVEEPASIVDPYADWKTYTNPTFGYSFKYPANWQVDRRVIQDPADWVSVNPAGVANPGSNDVLAFVTYADGTGCGQTETATRHFTIGDTTVEGVSSCGSPVYHVGMKHAKVVGATSGKGNQNIVLVRAAPNLVVIKIDTSRGEDEAIELILKSVSGLTAY